MRIRFFFTIFIVLSLTAVAVSAIHYHFFKVERLRLIELNLQQNATLLSQSDLSLSKKEFSNIGQEFINEVIGDDKVNMIIAIYSKNGNVLFKNDNAYIFEVPDKINPAFQTWEDIEQKEYFIKYLTQKDEKNNRIIKVGMLLNQSLIRWKDVNKRIYILVGAILLVITGISFFLSYLLFRPVRQLADMVNHLADSIDRGKFMDQEPVFDMIKARTIKNDEFSYLLTSLEKLTKKIYTTQQITHKWSALMAHELKTPMTLLRMSIDELISQTKASPDSLQNVENELRKLEHIIMDFLEWASVENDSFRPDLHAINVPQRTQELVQYLEKTFAQMEITVINKASDDFRIFCNPIHFDQMLNNLVSNAAKYGNGKLNIICEDGKLTVIDNGEGLPENVLKNFGKPFNKFSQNGISGHGLGLAWVNTIANKYNWKINVDISSGTRFDIMFPQN